jgi:hypothetical protein
MTETEIEEKVKRFWDAKKRNLDEADSRELEKTLKEIDECEFIDPSSERPVKVVDFVRWLNPESLLEIVKEKYPYFDYIKDRFPARMRFVAYHCLSGNRFLMASYRSLSKEDWRKIGFDKIEPYETLRDFTYERIGEENLPALTDIMIKEIGSIAEKKRIIIGERVMEDATDIPALKHDPESEYSGYYKEWGYKVDITLDADHQIPLNYLPLGINEDEGKCLKGSQEKLKSLGIEEKERMVDGKYATFENIASSKSKGIDLFFKIAKNWKRESVDEMEKAVRDRYQKYHNEMDFIPTKSISCMLGYLYEKGEHELVGRYYRAENMEIAHTSEYRRKCNERSSKMEGSNGYMKNVAGLCDRFRRRGWRAFLIRVGFTVLSLLFAALTRLQNGITKNLGNVTYVV